VPGSITSCYSQAPADLIKIGAKVVTDVSDILEELSLEDKKVGDEDYKQVGLILDDLGKDERKIVKALSSGNMHVDDIVRKLGMQASQVSSLLTMLEIRGVVKHLGGMVYAMGGRSPSTHSIRGG
jgi:DNA processing protein